MKRNRPDPVTRPEPGLRQVLADNASAMTHWGTNTYIVGEGRVAVIDPGPGSKTHLQTMLDALAPGEVVSHIFVTHSHSDHSTLARPLAEATGAPVIAFGNSRAGRTDLMEDLARQGLAGGGEGADHGFEPDEVMADGQTIDGDDWTLVAIWTPGHFANHLCFAWNDVVFTGDHIMEWATTLVSPPDGDLSAFMASTRILAQRNDRVFYPGHGLPVTDPAARTRWLLNHRQARERAILQALGHGPATPAELAQTVYADIDKRMLPMATRNVFAHLVDLQQKNRVRALPSLSQNARFQLI